MCVRVKTTYVYCSRKNTTKNNGQKNHLSTNKLLGENSRTLENESGKWPRLPKEDPCPIRPAAKDMIVLDTNILIAYLKGEKNRNGLYRPGPSARGAFLCFRGECR